METLVFLFLWILFILFFVTFVFLLVWVFTSLKNKTPFIPVSMRILPDINKVLDLKEGSVFCDLGSGDGRIVYYIANHNPKIKVFGIENNLFAIILSKINFFFLKIQNKNNITILEKDLFTQDLSSFTHIVSYLYPNVMDDLLVKFDKELKPGTKLISINYHFTNKRPISEIDLKKNRFSMTRKLYVYEF